MREKERKNRLTAVKKSNRCSSFFPLTLVDVYESIKPLKTSDCLFDKKIFIYFHRTNDECLLTDFSFFLSFFPSFIGVIH